MMHALGYSHTEFDASRPGRLCRGRERWIEPFEIEGPVLMHRLVISGATFTDDSARDALRGVQFSKVPVPALIASLFPRRPMLAFMEDGHPADIPDGADGVEVYLGHRAGGRVVEPVVRWRQVVGGVRDLRRIMGDEAGGDMVRGFAVLNDADDVDEDLQDVLFALVGMSTLDSPPARYQPSILHEVLERCKALILLHRDKHGPALGIYSRDQIKTDGRLEGLSDKAGALLVRFAIPPMLARWDRALAETRQVWMDERDVEFPVPVAPEPSVWEPRRRRRGRKEEESSVSDELDELDDMLDFSLDDVLEE
ncbi:MAG: hypothetical protein ACI9MC_002795 [Kiritimatiellia bacterium]|jgi:hypothetical protein